MEAAGEGAGAHEARRARSSTVTPWSRWSAAHRRRSVKAWSAGPRGGGGRCSGPGRPHGRGCDQAAGDRVGDLRSAAQADQVQAEVDAGGGAGRGEDAAVLDVEGRRVDLGRAAGPQAVGVHPVGGGPAAVEQAGVGQHEGAGVQPDDTGAGPVGAVNAATSSAEGRTSGSHQPETITVPACWRASRPCGVDSWNPVEVVIGDGSADTSRNRYQSTPRSDRASRTPHTAQPGRSSRPPRSPPPRPPEAGGWGAGDGRRHGAAFCPRGGDCCRAGASTGWSCAASVPGYGRQAAGVVGGPGGGARGVRGARGDPPDPAAPGRTTPATSARRPVGRGARTPPRAGGWPTFDCWRGRWRRSTRTCSMGWARRSGGGGWRRWSGRRRRCGGTRSRSR